MEISCLLNSDDLTADHSIDLSQKNSLAGVQVDNLAFELETGRLAALGVIKTLAARFPEQLLDSWAPVFFLPLVARLLNDDSPKCRAMAGEALSTILQARPSIHAPVCYVCYVCVTSTIKQPGRRGLPNHDFTSQKILKMLSLGNIQVHAIKLVRQRDAAAALPQPCMRHQQHVCGVQRCGPAVVDRLVGYVEQWAAGDDGRLRRAPFSLNELNSKFSAANRLSQSSNHG